MRLGNGEGSVYKLSGKRRKPWVARKTDGFDMRGYPQYKYIGYYKTRADALSALMEYNKSPYSLEKETIKTIYERFIVGYEKTRSEKSVADIKSHWKHLEPLYEKPIATISRREIQLFFDGLERSIAVKERVKILLKLLFDYSIRYDIIQPERIAILKYIDLTSTVEVNKTNHDRFTNEEIEKFKEIDDDISHILLFLIYTGLRAGEYCSMEIENDIIYVNRAKTAAGVREVPLSDKAKKLLPLPQYSKYSKLYYRFNLWKSYNGFENMNLHSTRYTTVSLLVAAKVDDRIIKAIVGHKGGDVTSKVYTKITNKEKLIALNQI